MFGGALIYGRPVDLFRTVEFRQFFFSFLVIFLLFCNKKILVEVFSEIFLKRNGKILKEKLVKKIERKIKYKNLKR